MALAFRLFDEDGLRVRAITLISTVGLVGLAIGPPVGGFVFASAPWQVLLVVNVPIAVLAIIGLRVGIAADEAADLHCDPVDVGGAVLGTATIGLALVAPTLFVNADIGSSVPWTATAAAVLGAILFVVRERSARYPLLELKLVALPLVSSGLAYKAASGLATAGLGYLVTPHLVASALGIAVTGTLLAALFTGDIATPNWSSHQTAGFQEAVRAAGLALTVVAAAPVGWGIVRTRQTVDGHAATSAGEVIPKKA